MSVNILRCKQKTFDSVNFCCKSIREPFLVMDPEGMCRLCLEMRFGFDLIEIFSENGQLKQLYKKILEVFHVEITETTQLPTSICLFCYNKLEDYWKFSRAVLENQRKLKEVRDVVEVKLLETETKDNHLDDSHDAWGHLQEDDTTKTLPSKAKTHPCVKCHHCEKGFTRKTTLLCHIKSSHFNIRFSCLSCPKTYKYKHDLNVHIKNGHAAPRQKEQCDECKTWVLDLRKHIRRHEERSLNLRCDICDKPIANRSALEVHKKRMHSERKRLFGCESCGKSFSARITLKNHLASHSGLFLYNCDYCERKFRNTGNKSRHVQKMHGNEHARRKRGNKNRS